MQEDLNKSFCNLYFEAISQKIGQRQNSPCWLLNHAELQECVDQVCLKEKVGLKWSNMWHELIRQSFFLSENCGNLKSDKSGFWMFKKRLGCKWSGFWMGIWKSNYMTSGHMATILLKTILNTDKNIQILNSPVSNGWDYG